MEQSMGLFVPSHHKRQATYTPPQDHIVVLLVLTASVQLYMQASAAAPVRRHFSLSALLRPSLMRSGLPRTPDSMHVEERGSSGCADAVTLVSDRPTLF